MDQNTPEAKHLLAFIERIETVESALKDEQDARKDIYSELAGQGYDKKAVRTIVRLRKVERAKRIEEASILETYMANIGMEG